MAKRFLSFFLTLFLVSLVVFAAVSLAPGDSSSFVLSEEASSESIESYRAGRGLDGNIFIRYFLFLKAFVTLDWGKTISGLGVRETVFSRLPVTLSVATLSILIAFLFSLFMSLKAVSRKNGAWDKVHLAMTFIFLAFPSFLVALVLVFVFAVWLKLFPVAGYASLDRGVVLHFRTLFLPSLTLAILHSSLMMRLFREELGKNMAMPFTRTALGKGMRERDLPMKEALKPSLVLILSVLSESIASSFLGAAVVENVFALPGIGSLVVNSALSRDVNTTSVVVMVAAFLVSAVYFLTDILSYLVDPRKGRANEEA